MSRIAPFSRLDQGKIGLPALPDYSPDAALAIRIFLPLACIRINNTPMTECKGPGK
jgi:hypothetical protein